MAKNIEIKAHAREVIKQHHIAEQLTTSPATVLKQEDTYFNVPQGRLKLREFPNAAAQLIYYQRDNSEQPKLSDYHISEVPDGASLKAILDQAYGIKQVVKKTRTLMMSGRTRIHLDAVEDLGDFIELEVVLAEGDCLEQGEQEAKQLMQTLGIQQEDLIAVSYLDLLQQTC